MNTVGLPVIKNQTHSSGWEITFFEEYSSLIFSGEDFCAEFLDLLNYARNKSETPFRRELVIKSFPLLCAVYPNEKKIYCGSRRLGRELALLKLYQSEPSTEFEDREIIFKNIKFLVEKISSLEVKEFPSEIEWVSFHEALPKFWDKDSWKDVDEEARIILKQLIRRTAEYRSSFFEKFSDYGLSLTAQFDLIRVHLLKFLALLPSLDHDKTGKEVKRNLIESLRRLNEDRIKIASSKKSETKNLPWYLIYLFLVAAKIVQFIPSFFLASVVRSMVKTMAKRFIAGENISSSDKTLKDLKRTSRDATLDQLGELVVSAREADEYFEKVLELIRGLKQHFSRGEKNTAGILKAHVSIKVSALSHDFKPQSFLSTYEKVAPRLKRILLEAQREEVFINIDAEHYHYRDLVLQIYAKVLLDTPDLSHYDQTGIVIQAYLRDGANHLRDVIALAKKRNVVMPIRLVKGAYWDAETIEGAAHQFAPPQFLNKEESDLHFRQLAFLALENFDHIHLAIGSHNLQDHAFVEALRTKRFPKARVIEHQCLHMTYEALSHGLAKMGWPIRNYMPIGNLLVGMAYLVRRIMENSSQVGVLSIMRSHQKSALLVSPVEVMKTKKSQGKMVQDNFITDLKSDFFPVRPLRLFLKNERESFFHEMKVFEDYLSSHQDQWKNSAFQRIQCSSRPELIVGVYESHTVAQAVNKVDELEESLKTHWWGQDHLSRVAIVLKAADELLRRRNEFSVLMMYEAGKTMTEALADVDEAIDFMQFYAREEIKIQLNPARKINRGVISVIAPWNFPLAIPCGMAVAPLVAGNAVILKPAEQTPLVAQRFYELLISAGVPKEIFALIQGDGEVVGAPIVSHHRVAGVVFTGSKSVGQWIYKNAADKLITHYEKPIVMQKKIITEMGGKNAVVVTNNCELDETVSGILYGAFGHAGQKCSAASRIIVHKEVKQALVNRLIQAMRDLKVGESFDPSTTVNPLIGQMEQERVRKIVEEAKNEVIKVKGKIHLDRSFEKLPGFCVGPTLLELPLHQSFKKESWAQKEIFGPVIHVVEYQSLIEAVELFNSTEYALTGGIYSQSQDDIDFLLKFLKAGNLYVNRPNTGARVAIEPFGGFKMSGTGPKAGGSDYLSQFHFFPHDLSEVSSEVTEATDTGYQLPTPRSSIISTQARVDRLELFAQQFFQNFEKLMGVLNEKDKLKAQQYADWLKDYLPTFINGKHLNYVIPGQLGYMDKSMIKDAGLFVMSSPRPSLKCIHYLISAIALGNGLSIVCLTEESYQTWREILAMIYKAGFTKANIDVTKIAEKNLSFYILKSSYSFMFVDQFDVHKNTRFKDLLGGDALNEHMRAILSDVDGVSLDDHHALLDQFVWIRAMAVNTMRHGAPLEMNA